MSGGFENHGFQPEPTNQGFQPPTNQGFQPPTNQGFQPPTPNQGSQSRPAGGFSQGGWQEVLNSDEMMAFARGSAAGVPVGYDFGLTHGAAKASSSETPKLLAPLGFVDTKETKAYGQGYQYGWAQGFSLGYFHGLTNLVNGGRMKFNVSSLLELKYHLWCDMALQATGIMQAFDARYLIYALRGLS
ncbi:hypothetical protein B0T18DRAFT_459078 [Schizothecium vesticola]|uniref:Uncharacterized protein n=1 Tax=Schizothecium vesticola TaxID=314040 RepID=A0AA40F792_9PEZI|nr:hypothetical protein B0T18DRAFT_459078 [Schizothecium vesticola]